MAPGVPVIQHSTSPLEIPPLDKNEIMKLESENSPPYEEAMNVSLRKVLEIKEEIKDL